MLLSKKIDLERDFAAGAQGRGEGGRCERYPERRLQGQKFTKPVENTSMTDFISSL
jgi:hypothetical protein